MASLYIVKQEPVPSSRPPHDFQIIKQETLIYDNAVFSNAKIPLVDVNSSSGSDKSVCSEGLEGEVVSSALPSYEGKKHHQFGINVKEAHSSSGEMLKFERMNRPYKVDDGLYPMQPSVGFLGPLHPPSNEIDCVELPSDFLEPLPFDRLAPIDAAPLACMPLLGSPVKSNVCNGVLTRRYRACRQFWKAGDYEGHPSSQKYYTGGMDHVRVHPKFLHSNATSHKWALGAVAELLDNALDEVANGATFVNADVIKNPRGGNPMLLIEDDGGGMNPDHMRQCMSLGYSAKSKRANTIGQYGNGFKTSTMRLGADVIVFSRFSGRDGCSPTQSIGILSYSFLRDTLQEDIIVPMVDYEIEPFGFRKLIRGSVDDWAKNMEILKQWSPYVTEDELLEQFKGMKHQGTRIVIYNLWEDDQGELELDFDTCPLDIQVRGSNRDEKKILMAQQFPNSRHYLTYMHSLRSYVSILYLRLPVGFRIILRGKDIQHHSLVDDLMFTQELTYKPQAGSDQAQRNYGQMIAVVTIGFVKDAKEHIDVQGFNVYHKNRLIKPFWRIWNSSSSQGRGIIGVLEANFVEPAHDKQGFEKTTVLSRLETRLLQMQKTYWSNHCHMVGYANSSVKKSGKPLSKARLLKDDRYAERVVYALPAPNVARTEPEVHGLTFPVGDTSSPESQIHLFAVRTCRDEAVLKRTVLSGIQEIQNPKFTGNASVKEDHRYSERQQSAPTTPMLIEKIPAIERVQSFSMQVAAVDEFSISDQLEAGEEMAGLEGENSFLDRATTLCCQPHLQLEIIENSKLAARIVDMKRQIEAMQIDIEELGKERDVLSQILLEEQEHRVLEDDELRMKLKEALSRVKELQDENRKLSLARHFRGKPYSDDSENKVVSELWQAQQDGS